MDLERQLIEAFEGSGKLVVLAIVIAAFLDSLVVVGLFVHGALLFAVSFYFYVNGHVSLPAIMIFALFGSILGDHSGYVVGRACGKKILAMRAIRRRNSRLKVAESWIHRYGLFALLFGRFVTPFRSLMPLVCTTLKMPYQKFLCGVTLSCSCWVVIWSIVLWMVATGYRIL